MNSGVTTAACSGSGTACSATACCACSRRLLLLFLPILLLLLPILLLPMSIAAFDATVAVLGDIPLPSRSEQKKTLQTITIQHCNTIISKVFPWQNKALNTIQSRSAHFTPPAGGVPTLPAASASSHFLPCSHVFLACIID